MKASDLRSGRRLLSDPPVARDATAGFGLRLDENGAIPGRLAIPSPASIASGETAVWNGTQYVRSSVTKIANTSLAGYPFAPTSYRKTTTKTVNTTVSPTDLFNAEITIAAGALGTTGMARILAWGDWLQNSGGAAVGPRLQLVLGATTLIDTGPGPSASASASRGPWRLEATIHNAAAANAQTVDFSLSIQGRGGYTTINNSFTTGTGGYVALVSTARPAEAVGVNSGLAVDTTAAQALILNVINGSASSTYETKLYGALVEII